MVISRGDESRTAHREIVDLTNMVFGRTVMTTEIKTSAEFDNSSARQQSVYDMASTTTNHKVRRSEEHTSELQSLMRTTYADFCLKTTNSTHIQTDKVRADTRLQSTTQVPLNRHTQHQAL